MSEVGDIVPKCHLPRLCKRISEINSILETGIHVFILCCNIHVFFKILLLIYIIIIYYFIFYFFLIVSMQWAFSVFIHANINKIVDTCNHCPVGEKAEIGLCMLTVSGSLNLMFYFVFQLLSKRNQRNLLIKLMQARNPSWVWNKKDLEIHYLLIHGWLVLWRPMGHQLWIWTSARMENT